VSQRAIMPVQAASVKKRYGGRRDTMNRIAHPIDHTEPDGVHVPIKRSAPSQELPIRAVPPFPLRLPEPRIHGGDVDFLNTRAPQRLAGVCSNSIKTLATHRSNDRLTAHPNNMGVPPALPGWQ
jgi:hypothetical protein